MSRPRTALLAVPLLAVVAVTSCAAGTDAATSRVRTTTNSVGGAIGTITVRDVYVVGPATKGGTATVVGAFFNGGADPDSLTAVSSTGSAGGAVPAGAVLQPGGSNIYDPFGGDQIRLTGLKANLPVGQVTTLTFSFARAGDLTIGVPVEPSQGTAAPTPTDTALQVGATPGNATVGATPTPNVTPTG